MTNDDLKAKIKEFGDSIFTVLDLSTEENRREMTQKLSRLSAKGLIRVVGRSNKKIFKGTGSRFCFEYKSTDKLLNPPAPIVKSRKPCKFDAWRDIWPDLFVLPYMPGTVSVVHKMIE